MTSIALWTAFLKLRPAAVANRAANASNNTPDTDQLAANYDEIKADGKAQEKDFGDGPEW
jgi:hypothetical protein